MTWGTNGAGPNPYGYLAAPRGSSRRGRPRPERITQAQIHRAVGLDGLTGEAASLGRSYAPAVAYDEDGSQIRDTRRLDPPTMIELDHDDHMGHDSRQRRRARERAAAKAAARAGAVESEAA